MEMVTGRSREQLASEVAITVSLFLDEKPLFLELVLI